jgi:glycerol uptake facilitator-like aquaporin
LVVIELASYPLVGFTALNPAIALATLYNQSLVGERPTDSCWIWLAVPYLGAILAAIFFELVYKKAILIEQIIAARTESERSQEASFDV